MTPSWITHRCPTCNKPYGSARTCKGNRDPFTNRPQPHPVAVAVPVPVRSTP